MTAQAFITNTAASVSTYLLAHCLEALRTPNHLKKNTKGPGHVEAASDYIYTMARGTPAHEAKVHYKGKNDDFIVIVESAQAVKDWKQDKSIPLAQVVNGWKVFVTHKYAAPSFRKPRLSRH